MAYLMETMAEPVVYRMAGDWHTNWFEQLGCLKEK